MQLLSNELAVLANTTTREPDVTTRATGTFEVKLKPLAAHDSSEGSPLGRMSIDKVFTGDLEATSIGEMLTAMSALPGSGAYVAVERVTGALHGRRGSFLFHHVGVMTRGAPSLNVTVVPDSGTGELTGLTGSMMIIIEGKKHSYEFDYERVEP